MVWTGAALTITNSRHSGDGCPGASCSLLPGFWVHRERRPGIDRARTAMANRVPEPMVCPGVDWYEYPLARLAVPSQPKALAPGTVPTPAHECDRGAIPAGTDPDHVSGPKAVEGASYRIPRRPASSSDYRGAPSGEGG